MDESCQVKKMQIKSPAVSRKPFWFLFEALIDIFSLKHLFAGVLLLHYLSQQRLSEHSDENRQLYKFLAKFGCVHRSLGYSGVVCCFLYPCTIFSIFLVNNLDRRALEGIYATGIVVFLKDPHQERQRLAERMNMLVDVIKASNRKYQSLLRHFGSQGGYHCGHLKSALEEQARPLMNLPSMKHRRRPSLFVPPMTSEFNCLKDIQDLNDNESITSSICDAMDAQYILLEGLKDNQEQILPVNRRISWHKYILNMWLAIKIFVMACYWVFGVSATVMINKAASMAMATDNEPELRHSSKMELIDQMFQIMFMTFIVDLGTRSLALMWTGLIDQRCSLLNIHSRLRMFNAKLANYHENWALGHSIDSVASLGKQYIDRYSGNDYDGEAMKIYLLLQVFNDEIKCFSGQAQHSLVILYCFNFFPTVSLISTAANGNSRRFFVVIICIIFLILNACMYPAALLNKRAIETVKLGWSLVSQAANLAHKSTRSHPITPHTLLLWRKLIEDHENLSQSTSSYIFSHLRLTFRSMLQFNFYSLSGIASYLTSR